MTSAGTFFVGFDTLTHLGLRTSIRPQLSLKCSGRIGSNWTCYNFGSHQRHWRCPLNKMMTHSLGSAPDPFGRHLWYPSWAGPRPPGRGSRQCPDRNVDLVGSLIGEDWFLISSSPCSIYWSQFGTFCEWVRIKPVSTSSWGWHCRCYLGFIKVHSPQRDRKTWRFVRKT